MSEIAIATEEGEVSTIPDTPERKAKQVPDPSGYRILCGIPNTMIPIEKPINRLG